MEEDLQNHIEQLLKIQSEDNDVIKEGEAYIDDLKENDCFELLRLSCSVILSEDEIPYTVIQLSFILIKQNTNFLINNWFKLTDEQKNILRTTATKGLFYPDQSIRNLSSFCFCSIASCGMDIFNGNILEQLSIPICNAEYEPCCTVGCFMALKELVMHDIINCDLPHYQETGQQIIDAYEQIMKDPKVFDQPDFIEFLNCYSIILPYFQQLYNEDISNSFLELLYDVFHIEDVSIHEALYELLFTFFRCFYQDIDCHMPIIFDMAANSLSLFDSPELVKPAIDFWINIAVFEIQKVKEFRENEKIVYKEIVQQAAPDLIDPMMSIITNFAPETAYQSLDVEDMEDLNNISICRTAIECLNEFSALTSCVFDELKQLFDEKSTSEDWHDRIASLYSFCCFSKNELYNINISRLDKKNDNEIMYSLNEFYHNKFQNIIQFISDPVEIIRNEAFSIISMIFNTSRFISNQQIFFKLISKQFDIVFDKLNKQLNSEESSEEFISDIIPAKICDIICAIAKQNEKRQNDYNHSKEDEVEVKENKEDSDIFMIEGSPFTQTAFSVYYFRFLRYLFIIFVFPAFQSKNYYKLQDLCSASIYWMFHNSPDEQLQYVLKSYLPIIFDQMNSQFELLQNSQDEDNIDGITRLCQLSQILSAIIWRSKSAIKEYSEPIVEFLIKFLSIKNYDLHDEGLITLTILIKADVSTVIPYLSEIMDAFFLSQDSKNNLIIEKSARIIAIIIGYTIKKEKQPYSSEDAQAILDFFDQAVLKDIFDIFNRNLQDDSFSLEARLSIVEDFGTIIRSMKIVAEPFFPLYVEALTNYELIIKSFNFLYKDDEEAASHLYSTILKGYGDLLEASIGLDFMESYVINFKKISSFLYSICDFKKYLNDSLVDSILTFVGIVLDNFRYMVETGSKKVWQVKSSMNTKIREILLYLKQNCSQSIASRASYLVRRIEDLK